MAAGSGTEIIYSAEEKHPAWRLALPAGLAPAVGESSGGLRVRIGGNARRLRLVLTDAKGRELEETVVDPGTAVRDAWLQLKPGMNYGHLLVQRVEFGEDGSFVIEGVER